MDKDVSQRFWAMVEKAGPNDCWTWTAWKHRKGYGYVRVKGRLLRAHRVAYELAIGPIPKGIRVLLRCDNPACVNPNHLFLGSHDDNVRDRVSKNRSAFGERNGRAKLTQSQAEEIRRVYGRNQISQQELADEYGISKTQVRTLLHYQN